MRALAVVVMAGCAGAPVARPVVEGARIEGPLVVDAVWKVSEEPLLAMAVRGRTVVADASGALVVLDAHGAVISRQQARGYGCRRWAISPSAHWAACEATQEAKDGGAPALEWFAVGGPAADGGVMGEPAAPVRPAGAIGWLDDDLLIADGELIGRSKRARAGRLHLAPYPQRVPTHVAPIDDDEAAFAGTFDANHQYASRSGPIYYPPAPRGLVVGAARAFKQTILDAHVEVLQLAAGADVIVIATRRELQLWHRWHLTETWHVAWRSDLTLRRRWFDDLGIPALAVSRFWVVAAEDRGTLLKVRDAESGDELATFDIAGYDVFVTALAIEGDRVYAATTDGRVIVLEIRR